MKLFSRTDDEKDEINKSIENLINSFQIYNGNKYSTDFPNIVNYIRFYNPLLNDKEIVNQENILESFKENQRYFTLTNMEPIQELLDIGEEKDNEGSTTCFSEMDLPHLSLDNIWDSLVFPEGIKRKIIGYTNSLLKFANSSISNDIVASNKFILFHGPAGTGKTSLAKAFAQKMSIRLNTIYKRSILLEINCHSLFSKWFSQSAKLVSQLFEKVLNTYAINKNVMVFVLIDEIESIGLSREKSMTKNDPGDVVRVLNSLLTNLDKAKSYSNIIFIGTSNMDNVLDEALSDRLDLSINIGNPTPNAIYIILKEIIEELISKGILISDGIMITPLEDIENGNEESLKLFKKCELLHSRNISARKLRKIPLISFAETYSEKMTILSFINSIAK
uniref:AAA domain-containing protein n=1 Tax=Parastrongyloides trichosuri TaxID=131310 RepID=A0A0N4ZEV9_PARTI